MRQKLKILDCMQNSVKLVGGIILTQGCFSSEKQGNCLDFQMYGAKHRSMLDNKSC